jgi:hypothetical protein
VEGGLGLLILLVWGIAWVWTLVDIVSWPGTTWAGSGQSKALWFILVFFFQFFGLLGYWAFARPKLVSAR